MQTDFGLVRVLVFIALVNAFYFGFGLLFVLYIPYLVINAHNLFEVVLLLVLLIEIEAVL